MSALLENARVYRFWRLRRLIVLALGLPWVSLALFMALTDGAGPVARHGVALALVVLWSVIAVPYVLRYPRAPMPSLYFGMATALLLPALLLGDWLIALTGGPMQDKHVFGLVFLGFALWFGLGLLFESTVVWLAHKVKRRNQRTRTVTPSPLSPAEALARHVRHPGEATALRRCGPMEADGRFAVWMRPGQGDTTLFDAPEAVGPWVKADTRPPDYWILSQDQSVPNRLTTLIATPAGETEALVVTVSPKAGGAVVTSDSMSDAVNVVEGFIFWLIDVQGDIETAENDIAKGRTPHRALCLLPQTFPGMALVKACKDGDERAFF